MNPNTFHVISMVLLSLMSVCIICMAVIAVKEKNKLFRNRENGIIDHYMLLQKFELLIAKILNDKSKTDEQKIKYYESINSFLDFIDSKKELKLGDVVNSKEKADEFMQRLKDLDK